MNKLENIIFEISTMYTHNIIRVFVAMETCLLHGVVSGRQYSNPYQVGTIVSTANSSFLKSLAAVSEIKN